MIACCASKTSLLTKLLVGIAKGNFKLSDQTEFYETLDRLKIMGTGSSAQPKIGVQSNPRIVYADQQAKKTKKDYKIDTPVLVDLNHGTIRYRFEEDEKKRKNRSKIVERPFEGNEKRKKGHYFYHPRLTDFSEKASVDREDPYKFMCVVKGPASAKQKKIFYVYGKGWNAMKHENGVRVKPTETIAMKPDPTWPQRQHPNDVYYNVTPIEHVPTEDPIPGIPNRYMLEYSLSDGDTVSDLRKKIALAIIKSPGNVHICHQYNELGSDVLLSTLGEGEGPLMAVRATLMDH